VLPIFYDDNQTEYFIFLQHISAIFLSFYKISFLLKSVKWVWNDMRASKTNNLNFFHYQGFHRPVISVVNIYKDYKLLM